MKGIVDESGRAILPVEILCTKHPTGVQVNVWIDTGFTGDLVLPDSLIEDLELSPVLLTVFLRTAHKLSSQPITASWSGLAA